MLKITLATLRDAVTACASEMVDAGVPVCEALTGQAARKITTCNQVLTLESLALIFHSLDGNGAETVSTWCRNITNSFMQTLSAQIQHQVLNSWKAKP